MARVFAQRQQQRKLAETNRKSNGEKKNETKVFFHRFLLTVSCVTPSVRRHSQQQLITIQETTHIPLLEKEKNKTSKKGKKIENDIFIFEIL